MIGAILGMTGGALFGALFLAQPTVAVYVDNGVRVPRWIVRLTRMTDYPGALDEEAP